MSSVCPAAHPSEQWALACIFWVTGSLSSDPRNQIVVGVADVRRVHATRDDVFEHFANVGKRRSLRRVFMPTPRHQVVAK